MALAQSGILVAVVWIWQTIRIARRFIVAFVVVGILSLVDHYYWNTLMPWWIMLVAWSDRDAEEFVLGESKISSQARLVQGMSRLPRSSEAVGRLE